MPLGFLCAALFILFARPRPTTLLIGAGVSIVGLLIRAWAAGHIRKNSALATSGPYAHMRNPLYFGSMFLAIGFAAATHSWMALALLGTYFAVFYAAVIRREEKELRTHYGKPFDDYAERVPLLWPRFRAYGNSGERFSWASYSRNREYEAALGFVGGIVLLWLMMKWRG